MSTQERLRRLIKRLTDSRDRIAAILADENDGGDARTLLYVRLYKIVRELQRAQKDLDAELARIARQAYWDAVLVGLSALGLDDGVITTLRRGGVQAARNMLETPETAALQPIDQIIYDKRQVAHEALVSVGRRAEDVVREVSVEITTRQLSGDPIPPREAGKLLADRLISTDNGHMGIRYSDGKVVPFDKYAAMVARTMVQEAANTAFIQIAIVAGAGLVRMSKHHPTCKLCAPRQGRVYRVTGFPAGDERNGFPHISAALPGWPQYKTVHPNCRHVLITLGFWERLPDHERRAMLEDAKKPFDIDPRNEAEIRKYNAGQDKLRRKNEDRKQYHAYKAVLGDEIPKSFAGFRRMKAANGESWAKLRASYSHRLNMRSYSDIIESMEKMSDTRIRKWYIAHNDDISNQVDRSAPLEDQARQAHELRNLYRIQARGMMQDRHAAEELDRTSPNVGFEELIQDKMARKGLGREEAYRDTIESASRTNKKVNRALGLECDEDV